MSYFGQQIQQILPGNVAVGGANMGMVPLFAVQWCPNRSNIWAGYVAADGQELSKATYPDADAGIQAGNVPLVSEATWQSTPSERGKYVATSSTGKFRIPDLNGKTAGSLGAVFLRGDGTLSAGTAGVIQLDEIRSHTHGLPVGAGGSESIPYKVTTDTQGNDLSAGTQTSAQGGAETRPLNVTGCWVIKIFGSVTNAGSANAAQLATDVANKLDINAFVGSNVSLGTTGYQKLPSGLIMQWGRVSISTTGFKDVTYPIAFSTATVSVVSSDQTTSGSSSKNPINTVSATGFQIYLDNYTLNNSLGSVFWVAIGY